jgi:fibronectin type 3 domain-containing protein
MWSEVDGASHYDVFRATASGGTYSFIGASETLSFTNTGVVTGKYYYYKVRAHRTTGTSNIYSKASAIKYARAIPSAPAVAVTTKTMTSAKITWTGVAGASRYQIYRASSATGTYTLVYSPFSGTRSYVNTGLRPNATYYYKVRAYHVEGTSKIAGYFSKTQQFTLGRLYYPGIYKVGIDIPAGEYLMVSTKEDSSQFFTSVDKEGEQWLAMGIPQPYIYATLTSGEYVTMTDTKAYPIAYAPLVPTNADGTLSQRQYKVGRDIPAGTYVLYESDPVFFGEVQVRKDSYNKYPSIVGQDFFVGRIYVTVQNGQYLSFRGDIGYPLTKAPALDTSSGTLIDGMYLVGKDIPAGTYSIVSYNTYSGYAGGYYVVYSNSTHSIAAIIQKGDLTVNRDVTVANGQYLFIFGGSIHLAQ